MTVDRRGVKLPGPLERLVWFRSLEKGQWEWVKGSNDFSLRMSRQ
jgi:hypothetical protein